jgi:hypothetical protein
MDGVLTRPAMLTTLSNGRAFTFPICFEGVDQATLSFDVRACDVARLLPRDLKPLNCGYGLSEMFVHWQSNRVSDLGSFSEILIGFLVEEPYYRRQAAYFMANPVTSDEVRIPGMELWGLRKTPGSIACERDQERMRCSLTMDNKFVLAMDLPLLGGQPWDVCALGCTGEGARSTFFRYRQRGERCAEVERPRDVTLQLGHHPLSETIGGLLLHSPVKRYVLREDGRILIGPSLSSLLAAPGN